MDGIVELCDGLNSEFNVSIQLESWAFELRQGM